MENKIIKRSKKEPGPISESMPSLKKEISDLQNIIKKKEEKILKYETAILTLKNKNAKTEHRFLELQKKFDILQTKLDELTKPPTSFLDLSAYGNKLIQRVAQNDASAGNLLDEHNDPPKK